MNKTGTQTIETERLILRRFTVEDAKDMFDNWASDPEVTKFLTWPTHSDVSITKALLVEWVSRYDDGGYFNWAMQYKDTGEVIGNISVVKLNENTEAADMGYCMGRAYWGQGLMPEALKAVMDFLFGTVGLNRIAACHDANNPKSGRVMDKAGMKREGILRAAGKNNQGICDEVWHSMLRKDREAGDIVTKKQYEELFLEMNPGYFDRDYVKKVPESEPASEMMLCLRDFDENIYIKSFGKEISFGYYHGDMEKLKEDVARVVPHWVNFFGEDSTVYCGFIDGRVASFCLIEDFGEHIVAGTKWKIGGPGCVGTLPEFRNRGIGLSMVREVTKILKEEHYDRSYIHYTYETGWYGKLGYKTFVRWNGNGFAD